MDIESIKNYFFKNFEYKSDENDENIDFYY